VINIEPIMATVWSGDGWFVSITGFRQNVLMIRLQTVGGQVDRNMAKEDGNG